MKTTDYWNMIYDLADGVVYGMTQDDINETTYHDVFELCNIHEVSTEYADDIYRVICNEWKTKAETGACPRSGWCRSADDGSRSNQDHQNMIKKREINMENLIDREMALENYTTVCHHITCSECPFLVNDGYYGTGSQKTDCRLEMFLTSIPAAQTEQLTVVEQMLFLAAMIREEKICKKVDDCYPNDTDDSLVGKCKEIVRKVTSTL